MKIVEVNGEHILFDNGNTITYGHEPDCCEYNYADFEQLDDMARNYQFNEQSMRFEFVNGSGFNFGDDYRMFFVPCYSVQDGYYSNEVDIYYNNMLVCTFSAEFVDG